MAIEQSFDIYKNNANAEKSEANGQEVYVGQLMMSFFATILYSRVNQVLLNAEKVKVSAEAAFKSLSMNTCKVYDDKIIVEEVNANTTEIVNAMKISIPDYIKL
jgi:hypothetical protein